MQENEMLDDLIIESREHLERIEPDLLELEQRGAAVSDELVNRVFRAVHSIKGGFGFFGKKNIVALSHIMENVMSRVRDKAVDISPALVEALLHGIDKLRVMMDGVEGSDGMSFDEEKEMLSHFISDTLHTDASLPVQAATADTSCETVRARHKGLTEQHCIDTVKNGRFLFHLVFAYGAIRQADKKYADVFQEWTKFGIIIDSDPGRRELDEISVAAQQSGEISLVFSTVLEPDLVAEAIGLDPSCIHLVDLSRFSEMDLAGSGVRKTAVSEGIGTAGGAAGGRQGRRDTSGEEGLRVKIGLLNNLMNFAGELVLARNQLMQALTMRFNDWPRAAALRKAVQESFQQGVEKIAGRVGADYKAEMVKAFESEAQLIDKKLTALMTFPVGEIGGLNAIVQNVNMVTTLLQESIMQTRLQPLAVVFNKFPRVIRDLARMLGKDIDLVQIGQDVALDKSIIELLSDPLTHLIRNCVDHGIEAPDVREKAGKSRCGMVMLKAYQEGGKVIIEITDDGAGIDIDRVKEVAVKRGVISTEKAAEISDKDVMMLIFAPGFSTVEKVSDISGRGVGMDVVKTNIERLGGMVEVLSEKGQGTTMVLRLPLTLAIIPSLIVATEKRRFAIPQAGLEEVVRIRAKDLSRKVERVGDAEVLRLRGKLLPLVRLSTVLDVPPTFEHPVTGDILQDKRSRWSDRRGISTDDTEQEKHAGVPTDLRTEKGERRTAVSNAVKVVVLKTERSLFGLVVDTVQDSEEIVVKPLPEFLKASQCYAGATIMGDGKVAMILDPNGIAVMAGLRFDELEKQLEEEREHALRQEHKSFENILLFSIGGKEQFGINLSSVARIEKRNADEVERVGEKEFIAYENSTLRLLRIENFLPIQPPSEAPKTMFVLVPKRAKTPVGFVTAGIEDTVETELAIETHSVKGLGLRGSAQINKKMTVLIDMPALLELVEQKMI